MKGLKMLFLFENKCSLQAFFSNKKKKKMIYILTGGDQDVMIKMR